MLEVLSVANITVQNSMVSDSHTLAFSVHGTQNAEVEFPQGGQVSWLYNFMAGSHRNPNIGGFNGYGEIQKQCCARNVISNGEYCKWSSNN